MKGIGKDLGKGKQYGDWRKIVFLIMGGLLLVAISACAPARGAPTPTATPAPKPTGFANSDLLAETDWLAGRLNDANLRIVDLRSADKYQAGHIPNSVNLPVADIYDNSVIKGMVLPKEKIEPLLGDLGISNETVVVAVDENGSTSAGRLFWTLDYYGHKKARLLNGGFTKWEKEGREITKVVPKVAKAQFTARADPSKLATKQQVLDVIKKPGVIIVDARTPKEYTGEDVRSKRGGHVPGAINLNWTFHLTSGDVPVLKTAAELKKYYEDAGVTKDKEIVVYCQTGTRSTHSYLVLKLLGYERVRNYDGSWEEWGNDPDTPIEK